MICQNCGHDNDNSGLMSPDSDYAKVVRLYDALGEMAGELRETADKAEIEAMAQRGRQLMIDMQVCAYLLKLRLAMYQNDIDDLKEQLGIE